MIALIIGYCCKKTDFDDDHVFQEEELPTIFYDPDDPPSTGTLTTVKLDDNEITAQMNPCFGSK